MKLCRFSLSLHANQKHAKFAFEMPTLVFAFQLDISFNGWKFKHFNRLLHQVWDLILYYHILSMQSTHLAAQREDLPNQCFPRQTKQRQRDAKTPDNCFFSSWEKCQSWLLFAIHSLIDHLVPLQRSVVCCFCCHNVECPALVPGAVVE